MSPPSLAPAPAQLLLLGPPRLEVAGQASTLGGKHLCLLGYLAFERSRGREVRRGPLALLLWPEQDHPRSNLSVAKSQLKRSLGQELLAGEGEIIALAGSASCDLDAWRAGVATQAPATWQLWRDSLLKGLDLAIIESDPDEPGSYGDWLQSARLELRQERLELATGLARQHLRQFAFEPAAELLRLVAQETLAPLEAPLQWLLLLEGYFKRPERVEAAYRRLRDLLGRQQTPSPEVEAAWNLAQSGDHDGCLSALRRLFAGAETASLTVSGQDDEIALPFVGRQREIEAIQQHLSQNLGHNLGQNLNQNLGQTQAESPLATLVRHHQARLVVVRGVAGVGKSSLMAQALAAAQANLAETLVVFRLACVHQHLALATLDDLLRQLLARFPHAPLLLPELWQAALARFLPDLLPTSTLSLGAEAENKLLFQASRALLDHCSEQADGPVVVVLEDAHWLDAASAQALLFLLAQPPPQGLWLCLTQRITEPASGESSSSLAMLLPEAQRREVALLLELAPLSPAEAEVLTSHLRLEANLASEALRLSRGNPFYLLEILRTPAPLRHHRLDDLIQQRFIALPGAAQSLLELLALLRQATPLPLLAQASNLSLAQTVSELE
jgi:DNA-binding SARP family transcriptional activator